MPLTIPSSGSTKSIWASKSYKRKAFCERDHQLEKLEFALAFSESKGDTRRSDALRAKIADLGGNKEEPGT